ncbi:MAG TPA: DinB family protein [Dehalococcoidia bacterium]|nr:DinB family protein [Dehalococcoidia bacterium]
MTLVDFIKQSLEQHYQAMARTVDGLSQDEVSWAPSNGAMSIGFLAWHYARTLDRWINSRVLDKPQIWNQAWAERFNRLPADPNDSGYNFTGQQVSVFQSPSAAVLLEYALAAKNLTMGFLYTQNDDDLGNVILPNPRGGQINLATMFQQLIWECNQHGGQMAYIRGLQKGIEEPGYSGGMLEARAKDAG